MNSVGVVLLLLGCLALGVRGQQPCPDQTDPAVIVVATIFATLAVVFIVAGVIFFLIWRRRKDLKSNKSPVTHDERKQGVANPAFIDGEGDPGLVEQGVGGYIQCREYTNSPNHQNKTPTENRSSSPKKSWSPISKSDLPPKPGSHGSLDDLCMDPEITSTWLHSQDFIGLGFNIAGSMRDGIFVSQVHNRGPAVESGKVHVGDRILSVTVSFENMVYEDALTILSYASPYPVKITLQKERPSKARERRGGHQKVILSHPLYRSQSMDTLLKINREPVYTPKRSMSEMRQSKEARPSVQQSLRVDVDTEGKSSSNSSPEIHITADVEQGASPVEKQPLTRLVPPPIGADDDDDTPPPQPSIPPPPLEFNDSVDGTVSSPSSATERMQFSSVFDNLNEQDKLDMIRLSYEDPETKLNPELDSSVTEGKEAALADVSFKSDSTVTEAEPKSPSPIKPERKKKKSSSESSSLSSFEESGDGQMSSRDTMPDIVEDHISVSMSRTNNAAPSQRDSEVFEDLISPQKSDRNIHISSDKIQLSSLDITSNSVGDSMESPREASRTLVDYSLSDMEGTFRPQTPEDTPSVDEDVITPVHLKKGELESSILRYFNDSGNTSTSTVEHHQSQQGDSPNTTVTSVEFNLNMNNNNDLFSTPYPKRNTKEGQSGMSYDISMMELNDIEKKLKQNSRGAVKQGVAFEVRDDVLSGNTVLSRLSEDSEGGNVARTKSCEDNLAKKAMSDSSLSWSGKRLVRAGSFSELPQDDSSDWMDHNSIDNDESIISQEEDKETFNSSEESLNSNNKNGLLKKAKMFGARENLANLSSDNSGSQQSIPDSWSGESGTPPPYLSKHSDQNGGNSSRESTPVKTPTNISTSNLSRDPTSSTPEGNGPFSLSGDITVGDEEDC